MTLVGALQLLGLLAGPASPFLVATLVKRLYARTKHNRLDQCRALYVVGVDALANSDADTAQSILQQIRAIEAKWQSWENSRARWVGAFASTVLGAVAYPAGLFFSIWFIAVTEGQDQMGLLITVSTDLRLALFVFGPYTIFGGLIALSHYHSTAPHHVLDDCGDRLERLILSPREIGVLIEPQPEIPKFFGLSAIELLGLKEAFTLKELNKARRKLAAEFHPDRWHSQAASVRQSAEDAMKLVNAAYDQLRPVAVS